MRVRPLPESFSERAHNYARSLPVGLPVLLVLILKLSASQPPEATVKKFLAIALAGCGVSNAPGDIDPTQPPGPKHTDTTADGSGEANAPGHLNGYRIEAI